MAKLSNAARGSARGMIWLVVLGVALSISAYSLFFVARTLGVPKLFAAGFSTAYDGVALIAADKSLQFAQEGKSGAFPRFVMVLFAGLSAFLNSLHAIFGHENPLAIPMWAGLPLAAVAAFEIHTSQARTRAHARFGYAYPAPIPKFGGWKWSLFPWATLKDLKGIVGHRGKAIVQANLAITTLPERRTTRQLPPNEDERPAERPAPERQAERTTQPDGTNEQAVNDEQPASQGTTAEHPAANVYPLGRARHAPERHIRDWAKDKGYKVAARGALPQWMKEEYANECAQTNDGAVNEQ